MAKENQVETDLVRQLEGLKYVYRPDIIDRKTLELNFRAKFEALNRVRLSDNEFLRLRETVINPDVFAAAKLLREQPYRLFQRTGYAKRQTRRTDCATGGSGSDFREA